MSPAWSTEPRYRTASQKSKTNLACLLNLPQTVVMSHNNWKSNPNLWEAEAEAGGFLNLRTAWSAERPRTIRATQRNSLKLKKKKLPPAGV